MTKEWIDIPLTITDKIGEWAIWATGFAITRIPLVGLYAAAQLGKLITHLSEMAAVSYMKILVVYDALPYGGFTGSKLVEIEGAKEIITINPCINIAEKLEGRHALIVGGTGEGKTTIAMYLAAIIGGQVRVYDADASPDEWKGLEVIGRGGRFDQIAEEMQKDLDDLQGRLTERGSRGDAAFIGREVFTIAEEFPLLKDEVENAVEWMLRHARRGRKPKRFICIITQEGEAKPLGLEGQGGARKNLAKVLTNKESIKRAIALHNQPLVEWLRGDRSRILVEDDPVQLPSLREQQEAIRRSIPVYSLPAAAMDSSDDETIDIEPETTVESDFQELETSSTRTSSTPEMAILTQILDAIEQGKSDDWIAKNIIPGSYYPAKQEAARIRSLIAS